MSTILLIGYISKRVLCCPLRGVISFFFSRSQENVVAQWKETLVSNNVPSSFDPSSLSALSPSAHVHLGLLSPGMSNKIDTDELGKYNTRVPDADDNDMRSKMGDGHEETVKRFAFTPVRKDRYFLLTTAQTVMTPLPKGLQIVVDCDLCAEMRNVVRVLFTWCSL
jgi:hypothetical protein